VGLPSLSFGWPTIAVDTHIYRVSNRTKLAIGKNVDKVEEKLLKVVPKELKWTFIIG
jgi:endonuclease-3